jgi:hypothetical protein
MEKQPPRWEDMTADEKVEFLREEDRHLHQVIVQETRHLEARFNAQINDLRNEIAAMKKKAKEQNILLG